MVSIDPTEPGESDALDFTGERMVPEGAPAPVFWEHIYRYRFASEFVKGKRVLDIACGEGYGAAALLKAGAASVVGVDICPTVCDHARRKYGIDARPGAADKIPLPTGAVDIVVSFETIEHVDRPELFLDECCRVLAPLGSLVMSTPNKDAYGSQGSGNPFHSSELTEKEFSSLIASRFRRWRVYTQRTIRTSWWHPRSLAAVQSPWLQLRGFGRLREMVRALTCPHTRGEVSEHLRRSPTDAVMAPKRPLSSLANEYAIRERSSQEESEYLVVVAEI